MHRAHSSRRRTAHAFVSITVFSGFLISACGLGTNKGGHAADPVVPPEIDPPDTATAVTWQFNGTDWIPSGTPPACPDPALTTPVDIDRATHVLYPGQYRGDNYKAHGGFLFGNSVNDDITVTLALGGSIVRGSRYIERGEVQYLFDFVSPCGIALRYDHLLTLSDTLQAIANTLPPAQVGNSATTELNPSPAFPAGFVLATAVGFRTPPINVSVDFGVYDLRQRNAASQDTTFARLHAAQGQTAFYGACWPTWFDSATSARVLALPGPGTEGKASDYCD